MSGPLRVLVVEGDTEHREGVEAVLEGSAAPLLVTWALTLTAALEHLEARAYDVVVLDLHLSDVAGSSSSAVQRIYDTAEGARLVVLTEGAASDTVLSCYEAGAAEVLDRGAGAPVPPELGVHLHGQALAARRVRAATQVEPLEKQGGAVQTWWGGLGTVQRGAVGVATVATVGQVAAAALQYVVPTLLAWWASG